MAQESVGIEMSKVITTFWYGLVGIVLTEDLVSKEHKAYIGFGSGVDEQEDIEYIKTYGQRVDRTTLEEIASFLEK